jgi:integrase
VAPTTDSKRLKRRPRGSGSVYARRHRRRDGTVSTTWWCDYWHRGKKFSESSHSSREGDAHALLRRRLAEIASGRLVGPVAERTGFEELRGLLVADYSANGRASLENAHHRLAHLELAFGHMHAADFSYKAIARYAAQRLAGKAAAATVRHELKLLHRMLVLAVRAEVLDSVPPFPTVAESAPREGVAEPDQVDALVRHLPAYLAPLVRFLFFTGWRTGEARQLAWSRVNFESGEVRLDAVNAKTRRARVFPMFPALRELLELERERTRQAERRLQAVIPWVFWKGQHEPHAIGDFRKAWGDAAEAACVPWLRPHDLRRSATRAMVMAGVPESTAMRLTGHRTRRIFDQYAVHADRDLVDGAARLGAYLARPHGSYAAEPPQCGALEQVDAIGEGS